MLAWPGAIKVQCSQEDLSSKLTTLATYHNSPQSVFNVVGTDLVHPPLGITTPGDAGQVTTHARSLHHLYIRLCPFLPLGIVSPGDVWDRICRLIFSSAWVKGSAQYFSYNVLSAKNSA